MYFSHTAVHKGEGAGKKQYKQHQKAFNLSRGVVSKNK